MLVTYPGLAIKLLDDVKGYLSLPSITVTNPWKSSMTVDADILFECLSRTKVRPLFCPASDFGSFPLKNDSGNSVFSKPFASSFACALFLDLRESLPL